MANNYRLIVTETKGMRRSYTYYFDTLEQAQRARKAMEEGGCKVVIKKVRS